MTVTIAKFWGWEDDMLNLQRRAQIACAAC